MINVSNKKLALVIVFVSLMALALGLWINSNNTNNSSDETSIKNFVQCMDAGYPVMESYPRQCRANGKTYVEIINVTDVSPTESVIGCTLDAKICPDGSAVGRTPPSCEFAPCPNDF